MEVIMNKNYINFTLLVALSLAIVNPVIAQGNLIERTKSYGSKALTFAKKHKVALITAAVIAVITGLGYRYYAKESEKAALIEAGLSQAQGLNLSPDAKKVATWIVKVVVQNSDGRNTLALFNQELNARCSRLEVKQDTCAELRNNAATIANVIDSISAKSRSN
jgi:Tfp pilus assembly major pilin PilA